MNVKQPIFEQSNQILEDHGNDYSNDEFELQTPDMITPYSYPKEDEFVHHEIANNFDSYDGNSDVAYESEFEQLTEYISNDVYVNEGEDVVYDDTPTDPDALMNDIFGVDSDDEVDTPTTKNSKSEEILDIQPRRSARNH